MTIKEQIMADMKEAMKARDAARLGAIRLLMAAIKQKEVDEQIVADDTAVPYLDISLDMKDPAHLMKVAVPQVHLSTRHTDLLMEQYGSIRVTICSLTHITANIATPLITTIFLPQSKR